MFWSPPIKIKEFSIYLNHRFFIYFFIILFIFSFAKYHIWWFLLSYKHILGNFLNSKDIKWVSNTIALSLDRYVLDSTLEMSFSLNTLQSLRFHTSNGIGSILYILQYRLLILIFSSHLDNNSLSNFLLYTIGQCTLKLYPSGYSLRTASTTCQ